MSDYVQYTFELDEGEFAAITEKLRELGGNKANTHIARALNKTATSARKKLATKAQASYTAKTGGFNKEMQIKKASAGNLTAIIEAEGETLNVHYFKMKPNSGSTAGADPVMNDVAKGGYKPRHLGSNGAFVMKVGRVTRDKKTGKSTPMMRKNRKTGSMQQVTANIVMARTGRSRLPIWKLKGPSVPSMLGANRVWEPTRPAIEADLKKFMEQQVAALLK